MSRWIRGRSCIYNVAYHVIWIPKYRKSILVGRIKKTICETLHKKAEEIGVNIEKYEIMPDHVHSFLRCKTLSKISMLIQQLKGYSSFFLRDKYRDLRRYKSLWAPSYYCETIGRISEETIKKYIDDQWKNLNE